MLRNASSPAGNATSAARLSLRLTPHGHLLLEPADDAPELDEALAERIDAAFARGAGFGLLQLGASEIGESLSPVFAWWREFAARYVGMRRTGERDPRMEQHEFASLTLAAPMMAGAEYITPEVLASLWRELDAAFNETCAASGDDVEAFLKALNPAWNVVGRVHFNLAENRNDADMPFAFIATYSTRVTAQGKMQHVPLAQALREYAGTDKRDRLLALLLPVHRAMEACDWLRPIVDSGEIYHALKWTPGEAARLLASAPQLEAAGVIVRMPAAWHGNRPARPRVAATVGARPPAGVGVDALVDFDSTISLDGEPLTDAEIARVLAGTESLVLLRGRWVEVDRERLQQTMREFQKAQKLAEREGLTFAQAMRMLAGLNLDAGAPTDADAADWSSVTAGPWLAERLRMLRSGENDDVSLEAGLRAVLRPYQREGVRWLKLLGDLGLGACLADDMGLGKTIQVLALLMQLKSRERGLRPSLLVAPASLLANWDDEIGRFAPTLRRRIFHPSTSDIDLASLAPKDFDGYDLAITSYSMLSRLPALAAASWHYVILDEAQAIKNHNAKQTRAAKALNARARIALTGTPVENHLGDLWSIFDFINPGLLGSVTQFSRYTKSLARRAHNPYGPMRELVRPYIMRRMKTDKSVIADLPDKTEVKAFCSLSRKQAALYERTVADLTRRLAAADGMSRRGLVLATLLRLKQICNHPSQWLKDHSWAEADSGKFARLREIAETVAARQEKMLVFTQFREMTEPLEKFLASVFGRSGLVLHGQTAVGKRAALVRRFQEDESIPFFVLSLKAGGSGLTLTAASHVVHFDRWWNPAVENQATDRAFRIGQKRNVLVHAFVCSGTVEEKVDALIESKKALSNELLAAGGEVNLTEMRDEELLNLVALDIRALATE
jgi:non-specific serine/threonine protein kinase